MGYKTSLIIGPDGSTQSHIHSLMGCFALASTKERATMKLKSAIPEYFRWLRTHGEDVAIPTKPKLVVVQELHLSGSPGDAGGPDPLLRCDKVPASHQDVTRCLRFLGHAREDLLQLLSGQSKEALDWKPKGEPRNVRNALRHVAQVDIWYLSRIDADPPLDKAKTKDVFPFLKYSRSLVAEALPRLSQTQLKKVFYPRKWSDKPYPWTATKVLHRLVTHKRQHTNYLKRILAMPGSPRLPQRKTESSQMIVGASSTRTRYEIKTPQGEHYVRCGAGLLLNGMSRDIEAEGLCPVCENIVKFQVRGRRVRKLTPDTSILHIVELSMDNGRIGTECEGSLLFDKEDCLHDWLSNYKGRPGSIIKPQEFLDRMFSLRVLKGMN